MKMKLVAIVLTAVAMSGGVYAAPVFSVAEVVTSVDRTATFDSLTSIGINLSNYSEDSLFVTVNDTTWQGPPTFQPFKFVSTRSTGFHYGDDGNNSYVSIRPTDSAIFSAVDFLLGAGNTSEPTLNLNWQTYLNGNLTGSGLQTSLARGSTVGWLDAGGFDELRVAASDPGYSSNPGFGNIQHIALDDVRIQVVPEPATAGMLAISGLVFYAIRRIKNFNRG